MNFITSNPAVSTGIAILVVSAAVSSLPAPTDVSPMWYRWFYKFSNTLMANVSAVRGKAQYSDSETPGSLAKEKP